MKQDFENKMSSLKASPKVWLVTGCAGFIGSNLVETLLKNNQRVVGLDNFSTGHMHNLEEIQGSIASKLWNNFNLIEGDITILETCRQAVKGVDYVLHQAALGSVPRSIKDPIATNKANIDGFLNMLVASKDEKVTSFTYAASSSTYGDHPGLPKVEDIIGKPLSPYAVTKYVNELYAELFSMHYGFKCIGLRYFNVFGKRQDPNGAYAAVIPKWISSIIKDEDVFVNGSGETSRDFCYIENVIQANMLASLSDQESKNQIYNIAFGESTTLNQLFDFLKNGIEKTGVTYKGKKIHREFREGDVLHSLANIDKASKNLNYSPKYSIETGLKDCIEWYLKNLNVKVTI